jgi:predicted DNA-binding transcriptional regulator AlpA
MTKKNLEIVESDKLIDSKQLADYLGAQVATVEGWRVKGVGPRYIKVQRLVRYRTKDVDQWLNSHTRLGA